MASGLSGSNPHWLGAAPELEYGAIWPYPLAAPRIPPTARAAGRSGPRNSYVSSALMWGLQAPFVMDIW